MWYPDSEYAHSCGGSIVDNSTIITIKDYIQLETNPNKAGKFKKLFVMVGSTKVQNGQNILVDKIIMYNNELKTNKFGQGNLALLKQSSPITFNENTQPICLPDHELDVQFLKRGQECFVSGWGSLKNHNPPGPMPTELQWGKVRVTDIETCQSMGQHSFLYFAL